MITLVEVPCCISNSPDIERKLLMLSSLHQWISLTSDVPADNFVCATGLKTLN